MAKLSSLPLYVHTYSGDLRENLTGRVPRSVLDALRYVPHAPGTPWNCCCRGAALIKVFASGESIIWNLNVIVRQTTHKTNQQ